MKAFCFPGQGPQEAKLVRELVTFANWPEYRNVAQQVTGLSVEALLNLDDDACLAELQKNEVASLITVLHSVCSLDLFRFISRPSFLTGYSVGQFVALYAAGYFGLRELLNLVWQRSCLMNEANSKAPGRMAAIIGLPPEQVETLIEDLKISISNYNARGQYTIAGRLDQVETAVERSIAQGAHKSVLINVEGAWHSPHMQSAAEPFARLLDEVEFCRPQTPVVDNVTGKVFSGNIREQLIRHLYQPVQWEAGIRQLISAGVTDFIEVGYGNMLSKFGFFISRDATFTTASRFLANIDRRGGNSCAA